MGFGVLLLCGAVFLDAADWFFTGWAERCNLPSTGGVVGNGLGEYAISPDGKKMAATIRGEVFIFENDKDFHVEQDRSTFFELLTKYRQYKMNYAKNILTKQGTVPRIGQMPANYV